MAIRVTGPLFSDLGVSFKERGSISNSDINSCVTSGIYRFAGDSTLGWGVLLVFRSSYSQRVCQFAINDADFYYRRSNDDGSNLGTWNKLTGTAI